MHPGTIIIHPRAKKSTTHEGDRLILHLKFYSRVYPPHVWKLPNVNAIPLTMECHDLRSINKKCLKNHGMSRHDLELALNLVGDMVPVSPLTTNVCNTHHETLSAIACHF